MKRSFSPSLLAFLGASLVTIPALAADDDVRLSSIGYRPDRLKAVTVTADADTFTVKRASDDEVVFEGTLGDTVVDRASQVPARKGTFTDVSEPGIYYVDVPGVGRSLDFPVSTDVYDERLKVAMLGFYGWRSGVDISFEHGGVTFEHAAGHLDDGLLDFSGQGAVGETKDGTGGWYDAGDYGKYTCNAALALASVLSAWEDFGDKLGALTLKIPETGGALPDFLAEAKFQADWQLKMQFADGGVAHKLTPLRFSGFQLPAEDDSARYFTSPSSVATADFAAIMAQASRVFAEYDADQAAVYLEAAERAYAWLQDHPDEVKADTENFSTGAYDSGDPDDRYWAAAELWVTTGKAEYLTDFEARAATDRSPITPFFDWSDLRTLGSISYLRSSRDGKDPAIVKKLRTLLLDKADSAVRRAEAQAFGRSMGGYNWGSNGMTARLCMTLAAAHRASPDDKYNDACSSQLSWLYGQNQYGRSQITGDGAFSPCRPHDRRSGGDDVEPPYPGMLVGGGTEGLNWADVQNSYETNEVAINWQGALVYALASQLEGHDGESKVGFEREVFDCQGQPPRTATADQTPVDGPPITIDDLADDDGAIPEEGGRQGEWFAFDDGSGTTNGLTFTEGGRDNSGFAAFIRANGQEEWGGGIGLTLNGTSDARMAYDASEFTGLGFWAKAANPATIELMAPDVHTSPEAGLCEQCNDHFHVALDISTEWRMYRVPWTSFVQKGFGDQRDSVDASQVLAIQFQYGTDGPFEVYIDDVFFTTSSDPNYGKPPESPNVPDEPAMPPVPPSQTVSSGCSVGAAGAAPSPWNTAPLAAALGLAGLLLGRRRRR